MKRPLLAPLLAGVLILMLAPQFVAAQPLRKETPNANEPGYLGLITDDRQEAGKGVRVMEAVAGGPAEKSGLQAGDLITAINGTPVQKMDDFAAIVSTAPAGGVLEFQVQRAGVEQKFSATLTARPKADERRFPEFGRIPEQPAAPPADNAPSALPSSSPSSGPPQITTGRALLGVETVPLGDGVIRKYKLPQGSSGAVVAALTPGAPAVKAGLKVGDVIVALDGRSIFDPEDLAQRVRQAGVGKAIDVTYVTVGEVLTKRIVLADAAILNAAPRPGSVGGEELPNGAVVPPSFAQPNFGQPNQSQPRSIAPKAAPAAPPQPMPPGKPLPDANNVPPSGPPQPAATVPPPPPPMLHAPASSERPGIAKGPAEDPHRIEALETRVRELEQRVVELEKALKDKP